MPTAPESAKENATGTGEPGKNAAIQNEVLATTKNTTDRSKQQHPQWARRPKRHFTTIKTILAALDDVTRVLDVNITVVSKPVLHRYHQGEEYHDRYFLLAVPRVRWDFDYYEYATEEKKWEI